MQLEESFSACGYMGHNQLLRSLHVWLQKLSLCRIWGCWGEVGLRGLVL